MPAIAEAAASTEDAVQHPVEEVDTLFRLALLPGERSLDFGRFCDSCSRFSRRRWRRRSAPSSKFSSATPTSRRA